MTRGELGAVLLAAVAAGLATGALLRAPVPTPTTPPRMMRISDGAGTRDVPALSVDPPDGSEVPSLLTDIVGRLDRIEARLEALERAAAARAGG